MPNYSILKKMYKPREQRGYFEHGPLSRATRGVALGPAQKCPRCAVVYIFFAVGVILSIVLAKESMAHPLGSKLFGHRMVVTLTPEQIKLTYVVEIPTSKLMLMMSRFKEKYNLERIGPGEEKKFNGEMQRYLLSNLMLTVGGETRDFIWDPNYAPSQGAGDYRFFEYRLYLVAPIDDFPAPFPLTILNQNFRMQSAVYHNEVKHLPGVFASHTNFPQGMGWVKDPKYRLFSATFNRGQQPDELQRSIVPYDTTRGKISDTPLLGILRTHQLTFRIIIIAIMTAFFLGAVHALSPGHGKALVAAYLVGSRGTAWHAFLLGIIVTMTHVISVVLLGVISLIAAQYVIPEYYMPFISLGSGLLIVGIGVWLVVKRARGKTVLAEHDELPHAHDHLPDRASGDVGWKTLLTFGITGGIVPCPSGMVVMLTAIAIGRIAFGLLLILFFSLGLAVVLIVIGILAVRAARLLDRFSHAQFLTRWLPLASAIVITILGLAIIYQGFYIEWITWR